MSIIKFAMTVLLVVAITTGCNTVANDLTSEPETNISIDESIINEQDNDNSINTVLWLLGNSDWSIANVVGSFSDSVWINDEYEIAELLSGEEQYTLYGMNRSFGTYRGSTATETAVLTQEVYLHKANESVNVFQLNDLNEESVVLAVESKWNAQPREVIELDLKSIDYVVMKLENYGYSATSYEYENLKFVYEIDLDGDGNNELIICESNIDESNYHNFELKISRYNKVNVLKKGESGFENLTVINDTFTSEEYWYEMYTGMNILDLNGDGNMEIILESIATEASLLSVFEVIGNKIEEVLSCYYGV